MSDLGTFVKMWPSDGNPITLVPEDEPRLDAAVSRWIASGGTVDSLLDVTAIDGAHWRILASDVRSWQVSTPETRRAMWALEKAQRDEETSNKQAVGIWDDED